MKIGELKMEELTEIEKKTEKIKLTTQEGVDRLRYYIEKYNIDKLLKELKVKDGDIIIIGDRELEYFLEE